MRNGEISLAQAAQCCGGTVAAEYAEKTFRGANFDTRRLQRGELFVAITGARDGHDFAADALQKGAAAVLASKPLAAEIPAIYVRDTVAALQAIAAGYRRTLSLKRRHHRQRRQNDDQGNDRRSAGNDLPHGKDGGKLQ